MPPTSVSASASHDRRKIASRKMLPVGGTAADADDSLAVWVERYLELAVCRGPLAPGGGIQAWVTS
jgi:hypothetical protein